MTKFLFSLLLVLAAGTVTAAPVDVSDRLQVLWDDVVVDTNATTTRLVLHHPEYAGPVMEWNRPWEMSGSENPNVIADVGPDGKPLYRMYYIGWDMWGDLLQKKNMNDGYHLQTCYAESRDGICWTRPDLGLVEFGGSKKNNILLNAKTKGWCSNFFAFKDTNPKCPPEERYKGITSDTSWKGNVNVFVSADGIHFKYGWPIIELHAREVMSDCHLCSFYHAATGKYHVYIRGHRKRTEEERKADYFNDVEIRQVIHAEFDDFHKMQKTRPVDFASSDGGEPPEFPLYYSNAFPYFRNPDIIAAFPTRYNQRPWWNANYDYLPDVEHRKTRHKRENRFGLALTDALFMSSRDGQLFFRFDEAFLRPGRERHRGWTYGSCYPGAFVIPTPAADGSGDELSIYVPHGHWFEEGVTLERWTIRTDGFVSRQAPYRGAKLVTKDLVFRGDEMLLNFSTSARGRFAVRMQAAGTGEELLSSTWMFGDRVDSPATFPKGQLRKYAGKPVRFVFEMYDCDIFSFRFNRSSK